MDELLKKIAGAPQVEFINTPEGFTEIAERSLECAEKVIYYLGRAEILMDAYAQAYEDGHYIPTRIKLGVKVKMLVEDTPMMQRYRDADSILLTCDGGGSNSARKYVFKHDLERLSDSIGLPIRVAHYPPYCSKYNPIERCFFPHLGRACSACFSTRSIPSSISCVAQPPRPV